MSDLRIDAAAVAAQADVIERAAISTADARDAINRCWKVGALDRTPAGDAVDVFCGGWIFALDSVAHLAEGLADWTQSVATEAGAADRSLAGRVPDMYEKSDLPKKGEKHYVDPSLTA